LLHVYAAHSLNITHSNKKSPNFASKSASFSAPADSYIVPRMRNERKRDAPLIKFSSLRFANHPFLISCVALSAIPWWICNLFPNQYQMPTGQRMCISNLNTVVCDKRQTSHMQMSRRWRRRGWKKRGAQQLLGVIMRRRSFLLLKISHDISSQVLYSLSTEQNKPPRAQNFMYV
jgi:hypothetical protein